MMQRVKASRWSPGQVEAGSAARAAQRIWQSVTDGRPLTCAEAHCDWGAAGWVSWWQERLLSATHMLSPNLGNLYTKYIIQGRRDWSRFRLLQMRLRNVWPKFGGYNWYIPNRLSIQYALLNGFQSQVIISHWQWVADGGWTWDTGTCK